MLFPAGILRSRFKYMSRYVSKSRSRLRSVSKIIGLAAPPSLCSSQHAGILRSRFRNMSTYMSRSRVRSIFKKTGLVVPGSPVCIFKWTDPEAGS